MPPLDDPVFVPEPDDTIVYRITFTRYKMGNPVLYMMRCEILRQLPPGTFSKEPFESSSNDSDYDDEGRLKDDSLKSSQDGGKLVYLGCWSVKKRFSELESCHQEMKKKLKSILESQGHKFPKFPPKTWFGGNTETEVQQRLTQLQHYYDRLLMYPACVLDRSLNKMIDVEPPDCLPHFKIINFGLQSESIVYATCEITDQYTQQIFKEKSKERTGKPIHYYTIQIRKIIKVGFSGETNEFIREDRLENIGTGMRVVLILGEGDCNYEINISCSNFMGNNEDNQLRIRFMVPSAEQILRDCGNGDGQVKALLDRIGGASGKSKGDTKSSKSTKQKDSSNQNQNQTLKKNPNQSSSSDDGGGNTNRKSDIKKDGQRNNLSQDSIHSGESTMTNQSNQSNQSNLSGNKNYGNIGNPYRARKEAELAKKKAEAKAAEEQEEMNKRRELEQMNQNEERDSREYPSNIANGNGNHVNGNTSRRSNNKSDSNLNESGNNTITNNSSNLNQIHNLSSDINVATNSNEESLSNLNLNNRQSANNHSDSGESESAQHGLGAPLSSSSAGFEEHEHNSSDSD